MKRVFVIVATSVFLLSCSNSADEADDLAKAQKCLDEVDQSNPASAETCLSSIEKYDSQQAEILKCGIYMTAGGLVENKVVQAYKALEDDSITNKEAAFMAVLALDVPNVTDGYTKAKNGNLHCQASGVPGLMYLGDVIVGGTYLAKVAASVAGGGTFDINNPSSISTVVNNMLAKCSTNPPDNACTEDLATLGGVVSNLASSYCAGSSADSGVCSDVNSAISQAGGNASNIGQALICYLGNKTFNPSTGACN